MNKVIFESDICSKESKMGEGMTENAGVGRGACRIGWSEASLEEAFDLRTK